MKKITYIVYVYLLICPIGKKVRYVGSSKNPKTRFRAHLKDAKKNRTEKQKWIFSLLSSGCLPIMQIVGEGNFIEARQKEEELVIKNLDDVYNLRMPDDFSRAPRLVLNYKEWLKNNPKAQKPATQRHELLD